MHLIRSVRIICFLLSASCMQLGYAQLSPPGLGSTRAASWYALGLRQQLDSTGRNQSMTYIGIGRISNPEHDTNFLHKQSIWVFNEEIYHKISQHWQYSGAVSYRRQNQYASNSPYLSESTAVEQEFRLYGRLSYATDIHSVKWTNTLRQEIRRFFAPDFGAVDDGLQLRSRLKTQCVFALNDTKEDRIVGSAEALFSSVRNLKEGWSDMAYKESRFCLFYSHTAHSLPLIMDVGYMNDWMGHGHQAKDAHYLALDLIWENPFGE